VKKKDCLLEDDGNSEMRNHWCLANGKFRKILDFESACGINALVLKC
jgi:hypothetical protein